MKVNMGNIYQMLTGSVRVAAFTGGVMVLASLICLPAGVQAGDGPVLHVVEKEGIRYIANQPEPGSVTAWEVATGKKLWEKRVSPVGTSGAEGEMQPSLIRLSLEENQLVMEDSAGGTYRIDLQDSVPRVEVQNSPSSDPAAKGNQVKERWYLISVAAAVIGVAALAAWRRIIVYFKKR
jgi:hypothetical protein